VKNNFIYNSEFSNIYERPNINSNVSTQILFGENFSILKKSRNFYKIKIDTDNYVGFIKKLKLFNKYQTSHKIYVLKSKIYKLSKGNKFTYTGKDLPFASKIQILNKYKSYLMFKKNFWIKKDDVKPINHKIKNFIYIVNLFRNVKYKWGGKTFKGIDCSGLVQIIYNYNNKFFPRDTVDQIKFKKGLKSKKKFKKGDIVFWKGHVGICINSKKFIHAYGPRKKVLIMPINQTIKLIEKTAGLKVKKIFSI